MLALPHNLTPPQPRFPWPWLSHHGHGLPLDGGMEQFGSPRAAAARGHRGRVVPKACPSHWDAQRRQHLPGTRAGSPQRDPTIPWTSLRHSRDGIAAQPWPPQDPEGTSLPLVPPVMGTRPSWHPCPSPGWWHSTSPGCPTGTEEEDQAPADMGLRARLRHSPAASVQAKQLLIKSREGDGVGGPKPWQRAAAAEGGPELLLTVPSIAATVGTRGPPGNSRPGGRVNRELLWG